MQEAKWIKFLSCSIFKFQDGEKLFKNIIGKQIINCLGLCQVSALRCSDGLHPKLSLLSAPKTPSILSSKLEVEWLGAKKIFSQNFLSQQITGKEKMQVFHTNVCQR